MALKGVKRGDAVPTRTSQAYDSIRGQILSAELVAGEALSEYQLAAGLGLSRTPIREALRQLEKEGLVRLVPGRGTSVSELSIQDIVEVYELRTLLECHAARAAASHLEAVKVEQLADELKRAGAALAKGDPQRAFAADVALHRMVIEAARNTRLARILATLDDQVHRIRYMSARAPGRVQQTIVEHDAIVRALESREVDLAERTMRAHLDAARDNALALVLPSGFRPSVPPAP